ncbi:MAG: aminotransferase class I/II-fold pyridoxal phosphate-dependent enzyme [Dehalococcoidales bacterium]|jgi:aminotransferase|nr:aminotransferase class I/II-fold pyridoxal phosphate-dependent enzyme [Dehalococcoidales bacterium]
MAKQSTIRLITRLADQYQAINLAQGFTDETANFEMVWGAVTASLGGTEEGISRLEEITLEDISQSMAGGTADFLKMSLKDVLKTLQNPKDVFNQYSYPFGLPELREAIADYTERFAGFRPDPETEITVVVGATEGLFTALKTICDPGDEIIVIQPFHEMYLLQSVTLDLKPVYITLKENPEAGTWNLDRDELEKAINGNTKAFVLNTPHNPTGKVFTRDEMEFIAGLCKKHGVLVITDEIYEHILLTDKRHCSMATIDGMREHTIVVNSISKMGNATGWRVGWVISPPEYTPTIRGIHDTIVLQAATPLQKGAERLLRLDDGFYADIRKGYIEKLRLLTGALRKAGFIVTSPEATYYLFADYSNVPVISSLPPMEAAMYLIEKMGVASVPGDNFYAVGDFGDRYLRFAFCRSLETLEAGAERLQKIG